jgi:Zn-dependent protease
MFFQVDAPGFVGTADAGAGEELDDELWRSGALRERAIALAGEVKDCVGWSWKLQCGCMSDDKQPPELPPLLLLPEPPKPPTAWQRFTKMLGPVGVVIVIIVTKGKTIALLALKFGAPILKTGGTMILSIGAYAMLWGWKYAVGFVLLIFVHELGHVIVARQAGLKVGAPMFIPFMGAFIALKDAPKNAWIEACVGIGGPLLGTLAAALCEVWFRITGNPLYRALAYSGFFLNLFNMMPVGFLDGGRIATALSPWLWIAGLAVLVAMIVAQPNFLLILILIMSLPRVWSLFRPKTDEEARYFEVTPEQRGTMAVLYFGLLVLLVLGMRMTHIEPGSLRGID